MVILCESEKVSRLEEQNITDIIGQHLGQKGVILCLKTPRGELVLHTRLRYGKISYEKNDVVHRKREWEATGVSVGRGSWVVGPKSWVVGPKSWVVGSKSWVVGRGSWVVSRGLLIGRDLH